MLHLDYLFRVTTCRSRLRILFAWDETHSSWTWIIYEEERCYKPKTSKRNYKIRKTDNHKNSKNSYKITKTEKEFLVYLLNRRREKNNYDGC